jgi:hypothetical protein
MATYQKLVFKVDLAMLQTAGGSPGGDYIIDTPLPTDAVVLGSEIVVTEALDGPNLKAAKACISLAPQSKAASDMLADLMKPGTYQCGGQQYRLQIALKGCAMQDLKAGALTVTIFYDMFALVA